MNPTMLSKLHLKANELPGPTLYKHEFGAMGVEMLAALETDGPLAWLALQQVPQWFEDWEQALSRFRPDSELSRLNNSAGRPAQVSSDFWHLLQAALSAAEETRGLVTPTVLSAMESAGYDRTFVALAQGDAHDVTGPPPTPEAYSTEGSVPDWRRVELDVTGRTVRLRPGVGLDFGGTAKGWCADQAASNLGVIGPTLVDAGGDIAVSGPMHDGSPWPIGIADPFHPDSELAVLRISSGGVATSGRDYRRWRRGGREMHHVIDPRTGQPAQTDLLTVTVVGPSALAAEIAAKAALILGSREGMEWLSARPQLAGLMVLEDGTALQTANFAGYVWS